eukprot:1046327-Rhodomonas_salina.1
MESLQTDEKDMRTSERAPKRQKRRNEFDRKRPRESEARVGRTDSVQRRRILWTSQPRLSIACSSPPSMLPGRNFSPR